MALVWTATDTDVRDWAYDNPISWSDAAIGSAAADRVVVLSIMSPLRSVASVTIGGVTATVVEQTASGGTEVSMWRAAVPTGTTATVAATFNVGGPADLCMSVGTLTGATAAPTSALVDEWASTGAGGTVSVTGTIPTGGIMLFAAGAITRTFNWTFDKGTADSAVLQGAATGALRAGSFGTAGSQTVTATGTTWDEAGMVGGIWAAEAPSGQFARPSSDVADGGWTNQADSNTDLYASIDEVTASDTDYIKSGATPTDDAVTVGLSSVTYPTAGTVVMRVRAAWL